MLQFRNSKAQFAIVGGEALLYSTASSFGEGSGIAFEVRHEVRGNIRNSAPRSRAISLNLLRDPRRLPTAEQLYDRLEGVKLDFTHDHHPYPFAPAGLIAGASLIDATAGGAST